MTELPAHEARELAVLRAYMATGRMDTAAESLGITRTAAVGLLARLRKRYGATHNTIALFGPLQEAGLLSVEWKA